MFCSVSVRLGRLYGCVLFPQYHHKLYINHPNQHLHIFLPSIISTFLLTHNKITILTFIYIFSPSGWWEYKWLRSHQHRAGTQNDHVTHHYPLHPAVRTDYTHLTVTQPCPITLINTRTESDYTAYSLSQQSGYKYSVTAYASYNHSCTSISVVASDAAVKPIPPHAPLAHHALSPSPHFRNQCYLG